jgi:hypothetical protein
MSDSTFIKFSRYGFFLLLVLINVEAFTTFFYQTLTLLTAQFFGFFALILG